MEAQFTPAGVTKDATRFNEESDVLTECSYARFKDQLIRRLSVSETAKLNHILIDVTLGDRTPNQPSGNEAAGWR